jgi:hypothetical protein
MVVCFVATAIFLAAVERAQYARVVLGPVVALRRDRLRLRDRVAQGSRGPRWGPPK